MINLYNCKFDNRLITKTKKIFSSGNIYTGNQVKYLEKSISKLFNKKKEIVALSDLSNAMYLLLKSCNIKKNDEILVASFNCLSSTASIKNLGAKAVWVDLCDDYPQMSLKECQRLITKKTKALILYHVAGYPANSLDFKKFCKKHNIIFIEDLNNSLGGKINNYNVGDHSEYSLLSFYPNRQLASINGGAIVCSKSSTASRLRRLRKYGINKNRFRNKLGEIKKITLDEMGYFYEMSEINAAILNYRVKNFKKKIESVRKNFLFYQKNLQSNELLQKIHVPSYIRPNCWVYFIRSKNSSHIIKILKKNNIESSKLHYPNHLYKTFNNYKKKLANTNNFYKEVVAIPCGWWLKKKELVKITKVLNSL
jgi:perosamine synthetase